MPAVHDALLNPDKKERKSEFLTKKPLGQFSRYSSFRGRFSLDLKEGLMCSSNDLNEAPLNSGGKIASNVAIGQ